MAKAEVYESYKSGICFPSGLWPNGLIYYKISDLKSDKLKKKVLKAIDEFNKVTIHCIFTPAPKDQIYFVEFIRDDTKNPYAYVGCQYLDGQIISLPEKYPNTNRELGVTCILHEMMHTVGFGHEHTRDDRDIHCQIFPDREQSNDYKKEEGVSIGSYDYRSVMHYGNNAGLTAKHKELEELADKGLTLSQGDRDAIRILYSPPGTHHGEWHNKCSSKCTEGSCGCGNCGLIRGGINCGYKGREGHWTCCMSEERNSECMIDHTGVWHAECLKKNCREGYHPCGNCGGGCRHPGIKGHWSCCYEEDLEAKCSAIVKKKMPGWEKEYGVQFYKLGHKGEANAKKLEKMSLESDEKVPDLIISTKKEDIVNLL